MTVQLSVSVRNAMANQLEATIGASGILKIRTGAQPANCATADAGTVLASITLPADWLTAASSGAVTKNGSWTDSAADASGDAGHFRFYDSTGTTCHMQGSITASGGGGDMTVDNVTFVAGQPFEITGFTYTRGNP